jgi:hypothetical protein
MSFEDMMTFYIFAAIGLIKFKDKELLFVKISAPPADLL